MVSIVISNLKTIKEGKKKYMWTHTIRSVFSHFEVNPQCPIKG